MKQKTCRVETCSRPIPSRQHLCSRCFRLLGESTQKVLLNNPGEQAVAAAAAEAARSSMAPPAPIHPPNESRDRFRTARQHAAEAMRILEGRGRR